MHEVMDGSMPFFPTYYAVAAGNVLLFFCLLLQLTSINTIAVDDVSALFHLTLPGRYDLPDAWQNVRLMATHS